MTLYIVTLREGSMCKANGLAVQFVGDQARVACTPDQRDVFWGVRLAFLRANPNN